MLIFLVILKHRLIVILAFNLRYVFLPKVHSKSGRAPLCPPPSLPLLGHFLRNCEYPLFCQAIPLHSTLSAPSRMYLFVWRIKLCIKIWVVRVPRHLQAGEAGPHRAAQQGLLRQLETFIKGLIAYEHYHSPIIDNYDWK